MSKEQELKEKVVKKIQKEFDHFIEELKECSPEVIIERAYEKVSKEEMLYAIQNQELTVTECKALLKNKGILDECYDEWLKSDGNFNEMLEYAVEKRVEHIVDDYTRDLKLKSKESR